MNVKAKSDPNLEKIEEISATSSSEDDLQKVVDVDFKVAFDAWEPGQEIKSKSRKIKERRGTGFPYNTHEQLKEYNKIVEELN